MAHKLANLKFLRKKSGLSQQELANRSGVSKKTIQRAESGTECRNSSTVRLAKALKATLQELCNASEPVRTITDDIGVITKRKPAIRYTTQQIKAIEHPVDNLQIISGAGAGKTQILGEKVVNLISSYGLKPEEIVVLTFTNKAASEIKNRVRKLYRTKFNHEIGLDDMFIGTIHSWCLELIKENMPEYLKYDLLDGMGQYLFIQRHYKKIFDNGGLIQKNKDGSFTISKYSSTLRIAPKLFNILREADVDRSKLEFSNAYDALERYENLLNSYKLLDFSKILKLVASSIVNNDGFRNQLVDKLKYIIIDEYQDTNYAQENIIRNLVCASENNIKLTVVGDDDQLIYGWNNALIDNMLGFCDRYENVEQIVLPHNFRSSLGILDCAYRLVDKNPQRIIKDYQASSHHEYQEGDILALEFDSTEEEGNWIADKVNDLLGTPYNDKPGEKERGLSYSDIAILVRTKSQAHSIVKQMEKHGIPYSFKGGPGLLSSSTVGEAAASVFYYLNGMKGRAIFTRDNLVSAWLNCELGLTKQSIENAVNEIDSFKERWTSISAHSENSIQRGFKRFISGLEIFEEKIPTKSVSSYCSHGEYVFAILGQFSKLIAEFEKVNFGFDPKLLYQRFSDFLYYSADSMFEEALFYQQQQIDAVNIMTIHAAKGLEFPAVFMPGMVSNKFPLKKPSGIGLFHFISEDCISNAGAYNTPRDEERRLAFVGMTRAEKYLYMSWAPIATKSNIYSSSSTFFNEVLRSDYVIMNDLKESLSIDKIAPTPKLENTMLEVDFSHLKIYMTCPYSYKLRVEYGFEPGYTERLGFGNIIHHIFCEYITKIKDNIEITDSLIEGLVEKHFHLPFTTNFDKQLRRDLKQGALERMKKLHEDRYDNFKSAIHVEKSVSLLLNEHIRLVGRMDLLRGIHIGKEVVDLKSSYNSQNKEFTLLQLKGYSLGEWENSGVAPNRVSAIYAEKPEYDDGEDISTKDIRIAVSEKELEKTKNELRILAESLQERNKVKAPIEYRDTNGKKCISCKNCDVNYICQKGKNVVA